MRHILSKFSLLLVLALNVAQAQDPNFHIYLCLGQSNMEGQGTIESQDQSVNARFQVMGAVNCTGTRSFTLGKWSTATPPLFRCNTKLGPADYFGRTLVAKLPSNIKVGVVPVAVAGCDIALFDKVNYASYAATAPAWMQSIISQYGGNPYARLVEVAKLAQKDGVIKGILLHQGETNNGQTNWPTKVKAVYDNLIKDLNLDPSKTPLLVGELVTTAQGGACGGHNSIIATVPNVIPNSYVISASGLPPVSDKLHFTSASYRTLGQRYAQKMLTLLPVTNNIPPVVSITAPLNNASFNAPATVAISASASDADGTISNVQFYNGTTLLGSDATAPYSFSWTSVAAGTYSITAKATDNSGAIATSTAVSIVVNPGVNVAPTVSITAPLNNASFTAPATVAVSASASDADGTVSSVQFFNGTTLLGSDVTAPYSFSWTSVAAGTYSITAKATDNSGAVTTSTAISITVTNAPVGDITGPDCGSNNTTITFSLNPANRANATSYNWWYTGSAASTAMVTAAPYSVNIQTGANFSAGQVCVGVNMSVAPWYKQYCKSITKCNTARALDDLDIETPAQENIVNITMINTMGTVVYSGNDVHALSDNNLAAGIYNVYIRYESGRTESKKILNVK